MTTSQPMTRARGPLAARGERPPRAGALSASMTFGWRALLKIKHSPNQLVDALMLPVIFTLSFTYLVGGAIAGSPGRYLHFFLPGVMVMAVALTTAYTGIVLNQDVDQGVFDRVRSLPVWQSSVLVGAMLGDVVRYAVASVVPLLLGLALGFRPDGGVVGVVLALLFLQVFAFSLAWIGTFVGVSVRTPTAAQTLSWTLLFILVVASNVMVPQQTMPGWLEALIKVNPISVVTTAMRGLMDGTVTAGQMGWAFLSCAVLVVVFAPLTVYRYGRSRD
ncbi:ABC transporter permease [Actinomadura luteofluorescens]|uniref:ABC transporter permease n=1 Tax=Actinomadura luteofluorescens TaxID=46163 RepID=UPI00348A73D4